MDRSSMSFSPVTRRENIDRLAMENFDILVIGGGITGAGIARRAARMGYHTALIDKGDIASGTSSRSSKLVHGGLRYLATHDYDLVYQASRQRRKLFHRAPHLVWQLPFVLPVYGKNLYPFARIAAGILLYEGLATFRVIRHSRLLTARQALREEPLLDPLGLYGAARYYDCGTDDARLTLAVVRDGHRRGALIANYVQASTLLQSHNRVVGVTARDGIGGRQFEVRARVVVSAVGPWTDLLLQPKERWLKPTKGIHIIVPRRRVPSTAALTFPARDDRFLFLIPYGDHAILGTTETDYEDDPNDAHATASDVAYILDAARIAFPSAHLNADDIISTYAGVRPLIHTDSAQAYNASREHRLQQVMPGLIAIAGGKLTTFRQMAKEALTLASRMLGDHRANALTNLIPDRRPYPGGDIDDWESNRMRLEETLVRVNQLPLDVSQHLVATYGTQVDGVLRLVSEQPHLSERIAPDLPMIRAQVIHAIRDEMALTLTDVLDRRLHLLYFAPDQGLGVADTVARWMAPELGWANDECSRQIAEYLRVVEGARAWRSQ